MNSDDNTGINDYFISVSRDVTPASERHRARVLYAPFALDSSLVRQCASILTKSELQRADRLAAESDKAHFIQRRAFRRFCGAIATAPSRPLSQIIFDETENGRPHLHDSPDFWFGFSSCRLGFLGAWSPTHGVGVDLEDQTRKLESAEIARQFFSASEATAVEQAGGKDQLRTFLQYWSLKEAALKSIGEGLPFGLDAFEFRLEPELRVVQAPLERGGPDNFYAHMIDGTGGCAALVTRSHVS